MRASTDAASAAATLHTLYGETMGTRWRVDLVAGAGALHALHAGVQGRLDAVVAQMSDWEADSDVSRYGCGAAGTWHVLPEACFDVLQRALAIAEASGGAFDPTLAPLVEAWGFGARGHGGHVPSADTLEAARARVGWQRLAMRPDARAVLQPGDLRLDLSAIAKGHGVDAVADWLADSGISAALVDVGGELRGHGRKADGAPWRVLVEAVPDDPDAPVEVLALDGCAVATSGDAWHHFEVDGRRHPHTLDPRTGHPVAHGTRAVTVVATRAIDADAWATALLVLGSGPGLDVARAHGLAARFVDAVDGGYAVHGTEAFDAFRA